MGRYDGSLRMASPDSPVLQVLVDLNHERMLLHTETTVLGDWSIRNLLIRGEDDGFHIRVEGEEAIIRTNDDPGMALELGLRAASPRLRRQMATRNR
ncbi:MAG TPA: hypothetical protein VMS74_05805 [Acidimicrobiia bacterium]|nr:hypothetical protein [Acidimicrobiia bacterium]